MCKRDISIHTAKILKKYVKPEKKYYFCKK